MFLSKCKKVFGGLLLASLCTSAVCFGQTGSSAADVGVRPEPNPQAADFSLRSLNGQPVTAESLRGKVVVLAFGASWLPLSRTQLQGVKKLADQFGDRGVIVYWVSTESDNNKAKNYAGDEQLLAFGKKYGPGLTVLRDPDSGVAKKLGIFELPSVVILDKQGNRSGEPITGLDPDGNQMAQLARQLEKIL